MEVHVNNLNELMLPTREELIAYKIRKRISAQPESTDFVKSQKSSPPSTGSMPSKVVEDFLYNDDSAH